MRHSSPLEGALRNPMGGSAGLLVEVYSPITERSWSKHQEGANVGVLGAEQEQRNLGSTEAREMLLESGLVFLTNTPSLSGEESKRRKAPAGTFALQQFHPVQPETIVAWELRGPIRLHPHHPRGDAGAGGGEPFPGRELSFCPSAPASPRPSSSKRGFWQSEKGSCLRFNAPFKV